MEWRKLATELLEKIRIYRTQEENWKVVKETKDATVYSKPSSEWKGTVYRTVGDIDVDPVTVFHFIDPSTGPDCPRNKWDTSIQERRIIEHVEDNIKVMQTVTHSGLGGLISSRDYVDLLVVDKNDEFLGTTVQSVSHPDCPATSGAVRGTNHPSALMCCKVPDNPAKTRLVSMIQTDLGGMLPQSLVDQALPSSQIQFFSSLKQALRDAGHLKEDV